MPLYIALLRGVNVSGKNKVPMAELKAACEAAGLREVRTYLNSGNVVFASDADRGSLVRLMETVIRERFGLDVPVYVMPAADLAPLLAQAPAWWGTDDKAWYDNLIFALPPVTADEVCAALGAPHETLEKAQRCGEAVFWTFDRAKYQKTNWWGRTASEPIGQHITIRTAGTMRKLVALCGA